ncbi:cysteine proteinase inhibitor 4 [Phtheirospermum japonicum]|uniref:Cysteine proteinase inhibitor 4 n=1 Tax=Phtheirospermum japonicum TaxID=374723 RepID=A0A830AZ32_9LAMI|nr:cysteine proteinase inhibitor 4 [Phtheirospermum japonicum]
MAAFKSLSFPLAILTIWVALYSFQAAASSAAAPAPAPGGRRTVIGFQPIKNLTDPSVVKIAKFAVAAHNKQPKATKLEFVRIISGKSLADDGLTYSLVISAKKSGSTSNKPDYYYAAVFQKLGEKVLKLVAFQELFKN